MKRLDLGGNVATHQRDSLHAPGPVQADRRRLVKAITACLAQDRRWRVVEAGAEVEALIKADPPLIQEAWYRLQGWYKAAVDRALG